MTTTITVAIKGPYQVVRTTIIKTVALTSPGVYVLSRGKTTANYVGRSDTNLRDRLLDYVGSSYRYFWYAYATSPLDAFRKECTLYHKLGGSARLDNKIHPRRPANCSWRCPKCNAYY